MQNIAIFTETSIFALRLSLLGETGYPALTRQCSAGKAYTLASNTNHTFTLQSHCWDLGPHYFGFLSHYLRLNPTILLL